MRQLNTKQKAEVLKSLLSGKGRISPDQPLIVEAFQVDTVPGLYDQQGNKVSIDNIEQRINKERARGGVAWLEIKTYSTFPNN